MSKTLENLQRLPEHPTFDNGNCCLALACQQQCTCISVRLKVSHKHRGAAGAFWESAECIGVLQEGIIVWGSRGEPMEARYVPPACAAHTNWVLLLGFTVMKPPLS